MPIRVLFMCGSLNQTTQMHQIAQELPEFEHYYSPFYGDRFLKALNQLSLIEFTVLGRKRVSACVDYLQKHELTIDYGAVMYDYDLVITCSDLVVQENLRGKRMVMVQEGMTDPEKFSYRLVRSLPFLPRWVAGTAANGISGAYDYLCVASEGYKDLFMKKGVEPNRLRVTGIPNFDDCKQYLDNEFPHRDYVLVCTSDLREKFKFENRRRFVKRAVEIANGRKMIFKLHPNENFRRASWEIRRWAPGALIYTAGSAEEMIANCHTLITSFSSTVYVGLALGKDVYSEMDVGELERLTPVQNACAPRHIAQVCREVLAMDEREREFPIGAVHKPWQRRVWLQPRADDGGGEPASV